MDQRKMTIRDVARAAGVSTGTVSAVLNERATVREETRRHVLAVMQRMGYQPSADARRLGSRKSEGSAIVETAVGIVIKEADNPFYTEVVMGAKNAFLERGIHTFVCISDGDFSREGELIDAFRDRGMSGVIIAPVLHEEVDLTHLFQLRRSGFPFTLLESVQGLRANTISVNNVQAAERAVRHLIEGGHQDIVHFAGPAYTQHTRERMTGVERAFSQSHLRFREESVVRAGSHIQDGYDAAIAFFRGRRDTRPTAATCFNDLVAIGVLRALIELGVRVPDDVSIIGFDDIPIAAFSAVPLTTISVAQQEMGRRAAENLLRQIDQPELPPEQIIMPASLVERASTRRLTR